MDQNGNTKPILNVIVQVSPLLDRLIFVPAERADLYVVAGRLRQENPDVRPRLRPGGVEIAGSRAHLLNTDRLSNWCRWTVDARRFIDNRRMAHVSVPQAFAEIRTISREGRAEAGARLGSIAALGTLDDHQVVNVAAMINPFGPGLCLFDEQGAGKTVSAIFAFDLLVARDEADAVLIVAPKSMVPEWRADLERFMGDLYSIAELTGSVATRKRLILSDTEALICSYDTAVSMEEDLVAYARRQDGRLVLVVDESFFVKNPCAARSRALRRIREWCGRTFVLCGTPAPNTAHDIVEQFNLVDFGVTFGGLTVPADREQALQLIEARLNTAGGYLRHLKANVLPELQPKRFHRILVSMSPDQRRLYEAALTGLIRDLETTSDVQFRRELTSFLARRSALIQLCSNPSGVVSGYEETPAKLHALDELLDQFVNVGGEKVVLWSFYRRSLDAIAQRYASIGIVRYDGSVTSTLERREAVKRFQNDPEVRLFIGNPATAGAGLTLHTARIAIYESMSNQAAHYLQSLDRIHRRGQTRDVEYCILLCSGTIDEVEYERLLGKEANAQRLLGDPEVEVLTRELMLAQANELLGLLPRG